MSGFNEENRWVYSAKADKLKFMSSMHIISLAMLFQYFIFKELPEIIYSIFGFLFRGAGIPDYFSSEEIAYIAFNAMAILTTLISCAATGGFIVLCLKKFGSGTNILREKGRVSYNPKLPKNTPVLLLAGVCVMELSTYAYMFLNVFFEKFFDISPLPSSGSQSYFPQTGIGVVLYFLSLVAIPALAEEFVCRYVMLNALKKYGNTFAILSSSIFFGFMHARMSAFIYATAMGMFLGYVAIKTKSVWFSVLLHGLINFVSFVFQYLSSLPFLYDESVDILYLMYSALAFFVCAVTLFVLIAKKKHRYDKLEAPADYVHIQKRQKLAFFFNAATIIFFALTILKSLEEYGLWGVR
ncbi:MAG: CPBP family intramembrane metalloprotease [Oscillospiraceae bacterium]|nr:CPBP family intramembrane metalloprotease [Oscillospiraceae bacterium]